MEICSIKLAYFHYGYIILRSKQQLTNSIKRQQRVNPYGNYDGWAGL
jgi:hypothetical protein